MRGLRCGLLEESLGCGGLTLANELDNPSCRTFYREPASNGNFLDYSNGARTVSNANRVNVTLVLKGLHFRNIRLSATLPCYGLSLDAVAVRLRFRQRQDGWMCVLQRCKRN